MMTKGIEMKKMRNNKTLILVLLIFLLCLLSPGIFFRTLNVEKQDAILVWYYSRSNKILTKHLLTEPIGKILKKLGFHTYSFEGVKSTARSLVRFEDGNRHVFPITTIIVESKVGNGSKMVAFTLKNPFYGSLEDIEQDGVESQYIVGIEYCDEVLSKVELIGKVGLTIRSGKVFGRDLKCNCCTFDFPYLLSPFNRKYSRWLID
jgi:hypothetical protein